MINVLFASSPYLMVVTLHQPSQLTHPQGLTTDDLKGLSLPKDVVVCLLDMGVINGADDVSVPAHEGRWLQEAFDALRGNIAVPSDGSVNVMQSVNFSPDCNVSVVGHPPAP